MKWLREDVEERLREFFSETDYITEGAWRALAQETGGPSSGLVTARFGGENFSKVICELAERLAPIDRVMLWLFCPRGERHSGNDRWCGSVTERRVGECRICDLRDQRIAERRASRPTFEANYPDLVPFLSDPADAGSRGKLVDFRCGSCGHAPIPWRPSAGGTPTCKRCGAIGESAVGATIPRTGGGKAVPLEAKLARQLALLGIPAWATLGVVVPRDSYVVDVMKPDVVIPSIRVALEVDHLVSRSGRTHLSAEALADDKARDDLLLTIGWRVLRIRPPGAPLPSPATWYIESTSHSAARLAELICSELAQERGHHGKSDGDFAGDEPGGVDRQAGESR